METNNKKNQKRLVKLIFNPSAGATNPEKIDVSDVIHELQNWNLVPETFLVEPDCDLAGEVRDALAKGIDFFVVCGGDGTICAVAREIAGTSATLGIIPIGTQNNTALSLNIPSDVPCAVAILSSGQRIKVDVGIAVCGEVTMPFIEACSVGLVSDLFPVVDDIQHGELARLGDLLATFVNTSPAEIHLRMDGKQEILNKGHIVLVSVMPHIGFQYQIAADDAYLDGLLDVLFFADLSKLDLVGYLLKGVGIDKPEDPRILHFKVKSINIETNPAMGVSVDGIAIGEGPVHVEIRKHHLAVMVSSNGPVSEKKTGEQLAKNESA